MAKKQSTRPNLLGIQKQMLDAGRDTRAESFMKGAMGAFAVNMAETEKQEVMMEKYMEDLGGIENIVKLPMEQRGQVEEFLRANRDEYSDLAEQYQKSKDPAIKDKMNAIKYKFQTLDTELSKFAASKAEYMSDYEEGNLMKGGSFAKDNSFYMGMYGNPNTQFSIGETGEMSFTVNGETKAFKDVGSHTLRNYEAEKNIDTLFGMASDLKVSGKAFDKNRITNNFVNGHKSISRNDLQAILQTDLTGDGDKPSFMDQWASGGLDDEFYNGVDKENITEQDVKDLLKDKQRGLDLMGKYVGNISQGIYDDSELDETVALTRKAKQAQINASNRANKKSGDGGDDETVDYSGNIVLENGKQFYRKDLAVRNLSKKYNDKSKIKDYEGNYWQWEEDENEDGGGTWFDGENNVSHEDMALKMSIPEALITGGSADVEEYDDRTEEEIAQARLFTMENLQDGEANVLSNMKKMYDWDGAGYYVSKTNQYGLLLDGVAIYKKGEEEPVFSTRTNFSDGPKADKAANDLNKWLENHPEIKFLDPGFNKKRKQPEDVKKGQN